MYNDFFSFVTSIAPFAAVLCAIILCFGLIAMMRSQKSSKLFRTRIQGFSWAIFGFFLLPATLFLTFCVSPATEVPANPISPKVMACDQHVKEKFGCNNLEFQFIYPPASYISQFGTPRSTYADVTGVCSKLEGDVLLPDNPLTEGLFYGCEYTFVCEFDGNNIATNITEVGSSTATLGNVRTNCVTGERSSFGSSKPNEISPLSEGK